MKKKCKSCHFSITDVVDVDENIEVMLFCSFHDCLPENIPEECNPDELFDALYEDNIFTQHVCSDVSTEILTEDDIPF